MAHLLADYTTDWLDLIFRWFHVTAAIVWIGTSFYFVALDNHLTSPSARSTEKKASAANRGRSTAAASTGSRSSGSRRRISRSRSTGTSGRPTGRGCPASGSSASSTTRTRGCG